MFAGRHLRIVCISDTHHRHEEFSNAVTIPDGDVLLYAGDVDGAIDEFDRMLASLMHPIKILVPGNVFDSIFRVLTLFTSSWQHDQIADIVSLENPGNGIFVLNGTNALVQGIRFYGHPFCRCNASLRAFQGMFMKPTIPETDVLITHIPPLHILDLAYDPHNPLSRLRCKFCDEVHPRATHWGSRGLRDQVECLHPAVHVFGHVHDQPGKQQIGETLYVNASSWCTGFHPPIVVTLPVARAGDLPFRQLRCAVGRYLHGDASAAMQDSTVKWRLTLDNKLENENGEFLTNLASGLGISRRRADADVWWYFGNLLYHGVDRNSVLDVDKQDPNSVILWDRNGRKNQDWKFV